MGNYGDVWATCPPLPPSATTRKPPNVTVTLIPSNGGAEGAGLLLCDVTAFAPRDIVVQWEGPGHAPARARLGPVTGDGPFAVLSLLRLVEGEGAAAYACVVQHPALPRPLRVA
uniref:Ig-like domain-containing protein n=1 Tax=Otus sunia TaxID=257818 RepID=A0A8C8E6P2_9STRI